MIACLTAARLTAARLTAAAAAALVASPALAATGPFFSLRNTDFIVLLAFLVFVGILLYFRVPSAVAKLLDKRAETIKADIAEARRLRDEAQDIYAGYERRQREVKGQAADIVANAKREAMAQAEKAKLDLQRSIERRLAAAQDQIASAENDAVRAVRDRAVQVAVAAATDILGRQMGAQDRAAGIDRAIDDVARHLN
mgnify:CR=1 FL=1